MGVCQSSFLQEKTDKIHSILVFLLYSPILKYHQKSTHINKVLKQVKFQLEWADK